MSATPTTTRTRLLGLDALRGAAIVLMIAAHSVLVFGGPWWFRGVVTKPVHLVFLVLLGTLWRPGFRRRHVRLAVAAVLSSVLMLELGITTVSIVGSIAVALPFVHLFRSVPLAGVVLGVTQGMYWPLPVAMFQPGLAVAFILVGVLAGARGRVELDRYGARLPSWLCPIGRAPLEWYVGHLLVLAFVVGSSAVGLPSWARG